MKLSQLLYGAATFVPGVARVFGKGGGDTNSAEYCYSVWLRHLVMAFQGGIDRWPAEVAELGPGDSLGIGLAALISGVDKYHAFDVVAHAASARNLAIFDQLIAMFEKQAAIPGDDQYPEVKPDLACYSFPHAVLTADRLRAALAPDRVRRMRDSIRNPNHPGSMIEYRAPWCDQGIIERSSIDMVFSQAVLEHVDDLESVYRTMGLWLKAGGLLSHQIDFRCHNTAREWNGHWKYSDLAWKVIKGKRSYLLNREPCSTHLKLLAAHGFSVVGDQFSRAESRIDRDELAPRFRHLTDDDLTISGAFIRAVKDGGCAAGAVAEHARPAVRI